MKIKGLRWWIIGLIALATVINYIDRQALGVLWPEMSVELFPENTDDERKEFYALISIVFVFSYAFGQAIFGTLLAMNTLFAHPMRRLRQPEGRRPCFSLS